MAQEVKDKGRAYYVGNSNKRGLFYTRKHTKIKIILQFIRPFCKIPQYLFDYLFCSFACGKVIVLTIKVYFNGVFSVLDPNHLGRSTVYYTASKILTALQYDASTPREYHNSALLERRSL